MPADASIYQQFLNPAQRSVLQRSQNVLQALVRPPVHPGSDVHQAAVRAGLPTDVTTLNAIADMATQGHPFADAAQAVRLKRSGLGIY